MKSYTYNNTTYFNSKFKINNFICHYEYYYANNLYHVYLENYELEDEDIPLQFVDEDLKIAKKKLRKELNNIISNGSGTDLIKNNYKVYIDLPDVLKDCFNGIAYHITSTINVNSIISNGLITNYNPDIEVLNASKIIDKNKPSKIEIDFKREDCLYLHPHLCNECFSSFEQYYKNNALFAVNISDLINNAYIASSGLGGFCMHEKADEIILKDVIKYAKLYWRHSMKLMDYIKNPPKNSNYDLSEIIINKNISPNKIQLLGYWDDNYSFIPTEYFNFYIKSKYKENYKQILSLYP